MDFGYGIGTNSQKADSGIIWGKQHPVAVEAWFTSEGKFLPLMIRMKDNDDETIILDEIQIKNYERKMYSGIPTIEFYISVTYEGIKKDAKLLFFPERTIWTMVI